MWKFLKETSGLAIFSFLLVIFSWLIVFIDAYVFNLGYGWSYVFPQYGAGIGALSGIISLIYIKRTGLKGRRLAILAIALGAFGFFVLVSL